MNRVRTKAALRAFSVAAERRADHVTMIPKSLFIDNRELEFGLSNRSERILAKARADKDIKVTVVPNGMPNRHNGTAFYFDVIRSRLAR